MPRCRGAKSSPPLPGAASQSRPSPPPSPTTTPCAPTACPPPSCRGQRDYFGAHTYQRTDRPGIFHTHWAEPGRPETQA